MRGLPTRIVTFLSSDKAVRNSHRNILTEFGERSGNLARTFAGRRGKLAPEMHRTPFGTEQKFIYCFRCKD